MVYIRGNSFCKYESRNISKEDIISILTRIMQMEILMSERGITKLSLSMLSGHPIHAHRETDVSYADYAL